MAPGRRTGGSKLDGRKERALPAQHPRRLYPDYPEEVLVELEAQNMATARRVLQRRQLEAKLATEMRGRLAAARKSVEAYVRAMADGDEVDGRGRHKEAEALPKVTAAFDSIEASTAYGVHRWDHPDRWTPERAAADPDRVWPQSYTLERVDLTWKERWMLDVERYMSSEDLAKLLAEAGDKAEATRRRVLEKARREATKAAGKQRVRIRKKFFGAV